MAVSEISDAEWQVMHVVWNRQPVSAQQVIADLREPTGWSAATIRTMLHRLVKKQVLAFREEGNRYLYHAQARRADCVRRAARSFMDRVFDGEAAGLLAHYVRATHLTAEEITELEQLLKRQEAKE